ncbi:MAG TPA: PEP-CTERM sorting domain-containing protein [Tepidisphaeraceae bacterium]|jgi:hypothetical protein
MGIPFTRAASAAALVLSVAGAAQAAIRSHSGTTPPDSVGFTAVANYGAYESYDANDGGLGVPAWQLSKPITSVQKGYEYVLSNEEVQEAQNIGWFVKARIRVATNNDAPDYSVSVLYSNGVKRFDLLLGATADGDPIAKLADSFIGDGESATGSIFTLTGGGSGFHTYEMRFDAQSQGIDLFIDGIERMSDYAGHSIYVPSPRLDFGAFGNEGTGDGRYNEVSIALVPEPASVGLLLAAGGLLILRRRRT